jgi:hypothetical protein
VLFRVLPKSTQYLVFFGEGFAVGDQKVCRLLTDYFKTLQQTFWNTNSGGKTRCSVSDALP